MAAAAEGIILESLLWCQLKLLESQVKVPAAPSQQGPRACCHQPGLALAAQGSLNTFCFIIPHPWWLKAVTITDPLVLITNLSAPGLSFFHIFKDYFYAFIDNNQSSYTAAFHCNQTVLNQTPHLSVFANTAQCFTRG